jgi:hypothetical protein
VHLKLAHTLLVVPLHLRFGFALLGVCPALLAAFAQTRPSSIARCRRSLVGWRFCSVWPVVSAARADVALAIAR